MKDLIGKALDEIYLRRDLQDLQTVAPISSNVLIFRIFYDVILKISLIFRNLCPNVTNVDENFPEFQQICWKGSKSPRFFEGKAIPRKPENLQKMAATVNATPIIKTRTQLR